MFCCESKNHSDSLHWFQMTFMTWLLISTLLIKGWSDHRVSRQKRGSTWHCKNLKIHLEYRWKHKALERVIKNCAAHRASQASLHFMIMIIERWWRKELNYRAGLTKCPRRVLNSLLFHLCNSGFQCWASGYSILTITTLLIKFFLLNCICSNLKCVSLLALLKLLP